MHLRSMQEDDLPVIISMTKENMAPIIMAAWGQEWNEEQFLQGLREPTAKTKVLIERAEIVGYVTYLLHPENLTIFIWSMMVRKDRQRQKLGKLLMQAVEEEAFEGDFRFIELNVQSVNSSAIQFYEHLGFKLVEVIDIPDGHPDLHLRKASKRH